MNQAVEIMLERYKKESREEYLNALKEIVQEIALLGLWRAKFFEHAAFYGGTALRILYGLDRFSEDLDFSLLKKTSTFKLDAYNLAVQSELRAFGFDVSVSTKEKIQESNIQSAFIKAGTLKQLINIKTPNRFLNEIANNQMIKIKMEVDIEPPPGFKTEAKYLLMPVPFSIVSYQKPDLFAGKLHAILCRSWNNRVKGRDWYDLVWYVSRGIACRIEHLKERLIQSGHVPKGNVLDELKLKKMLLERLDSVSIDQAKEDVELFVKNREALKVWSHDFFKEVIEKITVT